jgi:hypothetical protein
MRRGWAGLVTWAALAAAAQAEPHLFLAKTFPGSVPEYAEVRIARDGAVEYRETPEEDPLRIRLKPEQAQRIFELAEACDRFRKPLESGLPVAKMGEKLFRWEDGAERHEARFNYSVETSARELQEWYERIVESERAYYDLQRTAKYEPLGVTEALLEIESSWDRKRLIAPEQFLPLLDRVAKNERYMNMARERAAKLAAVFRGAAETKSEGGTNAAH